MSRIVHGPFDLPPPRRQISPGPGSRGEARDRYADAARTKMCMCGRCEDGQQGLPAEWVWVARSDGSYIIERPNPWAAAGAPRAGRKAR